MPANTETSYSAAFPLPYLFERGTANTVTLRLERSGTAVDVFGGYLDVYDPGGTRVLHQAVTLTDDVASATYTPASTQALAEGYTVRWTVALDESDLTAYHTFTNEAAVVRKQLYCPITDSDLIRRVPALTPNAATGISTQTTYQWAIDEAWTQIQRRLIEQGRRPNLVVGPSALVDVTLELALATVFDSLAGHSDRSGAYSNRAQQHRAAFAEAWGRVRLAYDEGDAGLHDPAKRASAVATWWLG